MHPLAPPSAASDVRVRTSLPPSPATRLESIDLLRGLVMVLMALDHARAYLHSGQLLGENPLDLATTNPALFLTRWLTHFCAPVFVFLAGTGAFLSTTRGKSKAELSWFLASRGAWLVFLELTFINWCGWSFDLNLTHLPGIVIWAIGWSMLTLAALIHLPLWAIAGVGVTIIAGHNLLDRFLPEDFGRFAWLWRVLHEGGQIEFAPGHRLAIGYPLLPWIAVMAAGYAFGALFLRPAEERSRILFRLGVALTVGFLVLRLTGIYGEPKPWADQTRPGFTVLSILDCTKYPPSLCYLLMTLGPALLLLSKWDGAAPRALRWLLVFGQVPMFYYLIHLPLIHGLAVLIETLRFGSAPWLFEFPFARRVPAVPGAGFSLPYVYLAWLFALALLYPACRWFARLKARRRDLRFLSYL